MPPFPTKHQTGNESSHDSGFRVYTEVKVEGLGYRRYRRAEFRASRRKKVREECRGNRHLEYWL